MRLRSKKEGGFHPSITKIKRRGFWGEEFERARANNGQGYATEAGEFKERERD